MSIATAFWIGVLCGALVITALATWALRTRAADEAAILAKAKRRARFWRHVALDGMRGSYVETYKREIRAGGDR